MFSLSHGITPGVSSTHHWWSLCQPSVLSNEPGDITQTPHMVTSLGHYDCVSVNTRGLTEHGALLNITTAIREESNIDNSR